MKLFKYYQFIKESKEIKKSSIEYWITTKDLQDLFEPFRDDEYIITYNRIFFDAESKPLDLDEDIVKIGDEIYPGWYLNITFDHKLRGREDLTNDFKSIVRELELDGHKVIIEDSEGEVNIDNLYFRNGTPIIWIPETPGKKLPSVSELKRLSKEPSSVSEIFDDGDTYQALSVIYLYVKQTEKIKIENELQLANIYEWRDFQVNDKGKMFIELEIEDMASLFLKSGSRYVELLSNGLDCTDYWSDYLPDINSLFSYHLTKEHKKSIAEYVLRELGEEEVLELIEDNTGDDLSVKTKEEIVDFLVNGKTNSLEYICSERDFELIDELRRVLSDHELQAQCEENEKEMYEEFDKKLKREEIDFTKEHKLGTKFYFARGENGLVKKYYEEYTWFYKVFFQERWITDHEIALKSYPLYDVFREWCSYCYFNYELDPYYSDYGSVEDEYLHSDFTEKIKEFL